MYDKLRALFGRPATAEDVAPDTAVGRTREIGGGPGDDGDMATTTGTGTNGVFVGRVSGDVAGDYRESGAEVRARCR